MRAAILSPVAAVVVCLGTADLASAAVGSVWTYRTSNVTGEFRRENGGGGGDQKGRKVFTFVGTRGGAGFALLWGASPGIRGELAAPQAILASHRQTPLTHSGRRGRAGESPLTASGGWAWEGRARSGSNLKYVRTGGGKWREYQNGQVAFTFRETARARDSVTLYDSSRGIRVKLTTTQAIVTSDSDTL